MMHDSLNFEKSQLLLDETGLGDEPTAVMAGVIADSHTMRVTKEHWSALLLTLSEIIGREIETEIQKL